MNLQNFQEDPSHNTQINRRFVWVHPSKELEIHWNSMDLKFYLLYKIQEGTSLWGFYDIEDGLEKLYKILPSVIER